MQVLGKAAAARPTNADWLSSLRCRRAAAAPEAQPLRLLYVATSAGQGGLERHSVRLAGRLEKRGAVVTYACRPGGFLEKHCRSSGIAAYPLVVRNSGDLWAAFDLARLVLRRRINIVHVHSRRDFVISAVGVALARFCLRRSGERPRLVLHAHLIKDFGVPAWLSGRFFEGSVDAVVAVSEAARGFLIDRHKFSPSFVSTLHNGVDMDAYDMPSLQRLALRERLRHQWGAPSDGPVVGMVGRLNAKGQADLLRAAPLILARFPSAHFVFAGPEGEDGDRQRLERLAEQNGIGRNVLFTGQSENIPALLAAFDVLVHLPSDESFGLALVEALAAGVPVVASDIGGCAEIIADGVTGLLVPPQDQPRLVEALSRMLDRGSPSLRQRTALAGRHHAEVRFSLARQVERLEFLYARLLSGGPDTR